MFSSPLFFSSSLLLSSQFHLPRGGLSVLLLLARDLSKVSGVDMKQLRLQLKE